jgi:3-deoxy-7-phosphoheptulonate synthase
MLVVMQVGATEAQVDAVCQAIRDMGFEPVPMPGAAHRRRPHRERRQVDGSHVAGLAGVAQVIYVSKPYKQVSARVATREHVVEIAPGVSVGVATSW